MRFELVTNRPIEPALLKAIEGLAAQSALKGDAKAQAKQVADACKLTGKDLAIAVDLGTGGTHTATVWTCDLSKMYVQINAEYRT